MAFEYAAAATFISVLGTTVAMLIHAIQDSRCTKINACCVSCDRDVRDGPPAVSPVPAAE
jgi:hypothetical protein